MLDFINSKLCRHKTYHSYWATYLLIQYFSISSLYNHTVLVLLSFHSHYPIPFTHIFPNIIIITRQASSLPHRFHFRLNLPCSRKPNTSWTLMKRQVIVTLGPSEVQWNSKRENYGWGDGIPNKRNGTENTQRKRKMAEYHFLFLDVRRVTVPSL